MRSTPCQLLVTALAAVLAALLVVTRGPLPAVSIHAAAYDLDLEQVRRALRWGVDPGARNADGWTPLHFAAESGGQEGSLELIELLLDWGADPDVPDGDEQTPLHLAITGASDDEADLLVRRGARVDIFAACALGDEARVAELLREAPRRARRRMPSDKTTPLHWLAEHGRKRHAQIAALLLDAGADVNAKDAHGATPLAEAASLGEVSLSVLLVSRGADVERAVGEDRDLVLDAVGCLDTDLAEFLASRGAPMGIHAACAIGLTGRVKALLEEDATRISSKTEGGDTLLHLAARHGRLDVVRLLVERGADLEADAVWRGRPLHEAVRSGDLRVVDRLVTAGADVNARDRKGNTPVSLRACGRPMVEYFVRRRADVDIVVACYHGMTEQAKDLLASDPALASHAIPGCLPPLRLAAEQGHLEVVRLLLDGGAHPNGEGPPLPGPLDRAVCAGHREVADLLIARGADVGLFAACGLGMTERVRSLLDAGESVNQYDGLRAALPLHWAAAGGHKDTVELLLARGADVRAPDLPYRWTPLHSAASYGHTAVAAILLDHGADVDAKTKWGRRTPLSLAAEAGHAEMVRWLIAHGADVHPEGDDGWTPLHWAAIPEDPSALDVLLGHGAAVNAADSEGVTPLHHAVRSARVESARHLIARGADVGARDVLGRTPLHVAAARGHLEAARLLLDHGADPQARDLIGRTPLVLATRNGHDEVVELLRGSRKTE